MLADLESDGRSVAWIVLLGLGGAAAIADLIWIFALSGFLRLLRERHPESFRQLGSPSVYDIHWSFDAFRRTTQVYGFLARHSQPGTASPDLQSRCRRLRMLFLLLVGFVGAYLVAFATTAIMYPGPRTSNQAIQRTAR